MTKFDLEQALATQMKQVGLPTPVRQFKAIPGRKFAFDFAWPDAKNKLLVEVNGGIWIKGGHSTGLGISRDYEKSNLAQINGYKVFHFSSDMINNGTAVETIEKED